MGIGAHLSAGFVAGLASSVVLQPLDLAKTRLQQDGSSVSTVLHNLRQEPILGLWRGTLPSALRMSIGVSLYFGSMGRLREMLSTQAMGQRRSSSLPQLPMATNLALGTGTRVAIGFVTMPLTVIKTRFESSMYNYSSIREAFQAIRGEGWRRLWTGFGPTALRDAPYAGIYILLYEKSKDILDQRLNYSAAINMTSAFTASLVATFVTAPFDTVKTRMQLEPTKYPTFASTTLRIIREEWVSALFRGLGLRLVRKGLSSGIAWVVYEELLKRK